MSGSVTTGRRESFPAGDSLALTPFGGAEYNAAGMGWTDGSRRPLGPLVGPIRMQQTGYRSVLYLDSWTAAQPPRFAPPPRRLPASSRTGTATDARGDE